MGRLKRPSALSLIVLSRYADGCVRPPHTMLVLGMHRFSPLVLTVTRSHDSISENLRKSWRSVPFPFCSGRGGREQVLESMTPSRLISFLEPRATYHYA